MKVAGARLIGWRDQSVRMLKPLVDVSRQADVHVSENRTGGGIPAFVRKGGRGSQINALGSLSKTLSGDVDRLIRKGGTGCQVDAFVGKSRAGRDVRPHVDVTGMSVLRHQDIHREKSGGTHQGTCETTGQASSDGARKTVHNYLALLISTWGEWRC